MQIFNEFSGYIARGVNCCLHTCGAVGNRRDQDSRGGWGCCVQAVSIILKYMFYCSVYDIDISESIL